MNKQKNRYLLLIAAAIVNFSFGSAYIWSVFQPEAMERFNLASASASRPFNVFMAFFVLGNISGGKLQQKIGTRFTILGGSFLMCLGFLLTAYIPTDMGFLISITYGIMGGTGAGAAYNALIAGTQKWFPDKRGMVTGIIICTVGAPGLIMTPILNTYITKFGFTVAMEIVAIIYFVICFGLGWIITSPPEGYMSDYVAPTKNSIAKPTRATKNFTTQEMLHTRQYYLVTAAMLLAVIAYFLINPMMKSLGMERGLSEAVAITGIMVSSILNVCGRLIAPWVSDKLGRKQMLIILFTISMCSVISLIFAQGFLFLILVAFISFSYGGFFGIFPVIVAEYFGSQYSGMNYGMVMIGYGVMSILCPYILAVGVGVSFAVAGGACVLGMICTLVVKNPQEL